MQPTSLPAVPRKPSAAIAPAPALLPVEYARLLLKEGRRRIVPLALVFAAIAMLTFLAGTFVLPKQYEVSVTILAQDSDIIRPLLEGRAVPTGVADRAGMARPIVYSHKLLARIIDIGGWDRDGTLTPLQKDRLMEEIRGRTLVTSPRPDLVQITYHDTDPERAYQVTDAMGALFIQETLSNKERESRDAYEFIDTQVQAYQRKLVEAENNLHQYRIANEDAQPGSAVDASSRISALRNQVEQTRMALLDHEARVASISAQLSGESAVTTVQTREMLHRARVIELQAELDRLLLTYTDRHPDVVRTRHQMEDAQRQLEQELHRAASPSAANGIGVDSQLNPLYEELRSQLAQAQRDLAATRSRMGASESLLADEMQRSRRIAAQEGALAELTRDYEVNRDIYQDMLRRRENARVSMGLDQENRGLTLRVQDPATLPLRPTGLRFMHVAAGGLLAAIAVPLGLLWLLVRFDPRVRSPQVVETKSRYPLLATIPAYPSPRERRRQYFDMGIGLFLVTAMVLLYLVTYLQKMSHG